jgi:serine/threonine protein kinase
MKISPPKTETENVRRKLPHNKIACIHNNVLKPDVEIKAKFINGVYKGYDKKNKRDVIIKQVNTMTYDLITSCNYTENLPIQSSLWAEITALKLCSLLVKQGVCFNLPTLYDYSFCEHCGPTKNEKAGKPCLYMNAEFIPSGTFKRWILSEPHSLEEWYNAYAQILIGLYALQKYFDLTHHDLHWENILVQKVKPGGYWKYKIDGKVYFIPNEGYKFIIWDFEFCKIPDKIETYGLREYHAKQEPRELMDYFRISFAYSWAMNEENKPANFFPPEVPHILKQFQNAFKAGRSLKSLLQQYLGPYTEIHEESGKLIKSYNMDRVVTARELSNFFKTSERKPRVPSATQKNRARKENKSSESFKLKMSQLRLTQ